MIDVHFVRFDLDAEALLEKRDEPKACERIQDAVSDQTHVVVQIVRILAGQELFRDVIPDDGPDFVMLHENPLAPGHKRRPIRVAAASCTP